MTQEFRGRTAQEALAEVWASIDGKIEAFYEGKGKSVFKDKTGHYAGYMAEAREALERLNELGFWVAPWEPTEVMRQAWFQVDDRMPAPVTEVFEREWAAMRDACLAQRKGRDKIPVA